MNETILLDNGMDLHVVNKEDGDYTEFRHTLFEGMSLDDICREASQAKIEADKRMISNR